LRFRLPTTLPRLRRHELLPVTASIALVAIIGVQIVTPLHTPLPADPGSAMRRIRTAAAAPVPAYPGVVGSAIFSPDRSPGADAGGIGGADAAQAIGVIGVGRAAAALVKIGGGPIRFVRAGETIGGWRVAAIAAGSIKLAKGGQRRMLVVGAAPPTTPAPQAAGAPEATQ
jgi:hypothetical protein